MTPAQLTTLRTALLASADPEVVAAVAARNDTEVARLLNLPANPAFYVWRSTLARHEILTQTSEDGTTFAWAGGAYITRSQGERDAFREMFNSTGEVDPSLPTISAAFNDIFSGAGGAGNRAHILAMSRRKATLVEKFFAVGAGTVVSLAKLTFEGMVTIDDVGQALNG